MVRLFEVMDEQNKFSFDADNTAYNIYRFLNILRRIDDKTLSAKMTSGDVEKWLPLVQSHKDDKIRELRERISRHEVQDVRSELFKILRSREWFLECLSSMLRQGGWRFWFRIGIGTILLVPGFFYNTWLLYTPGVAALAIPVSAYVIGALGVFRPDIELSKSVYEGLKFTVELMTAITGAMLVLISGHTSLVKYASISLAASLVFGILAVFNVVTAGHDEKDNSIRVNLVSWDWIESLILFQFLSFLTGGVALTLNILS